MNLPTIIDPCPIREANVEIRFESKVPAEAVFGIVYSGLRGSYAVPSPTPIVQIPEFVRANDPNLQYQAHYKVKKDNFLLQLGPRMISLAAVETYPGWDLYLREILDVFRKIEQLDFILEITRLGIRYVNVFKTDIFEKVNLQIIVNDAAVNSKETYVRALFEGTSFNTLLQVANNALIQTDDGNQTKGSLIDIDVSNQSQKMPFFENVERLLNEAHQIEKTKFFELLKDDFLATLNPVYGEE